MLHSNHLSLYKLYRREEEELQKRLRQIFHTFSASRDERDTNERGTTNERVTHKRERKREEGLVVEEREDDFFEDFYDERVDEEEEILLGRRRRESERETKKGKDGTKARTNATTTGSSNNKGENVTKLLQDELGDDKAWWERIMREKEEREKRIYEALK